MDDTNNKDADLRSDEQDLEVIEVDDPEFQTQPDTQDQEEDDPSDKLTPDHPRFKDVLNRAKQAESRVETLEVQLAELNEKIEARQDRTGDDELTTAERESLEIIEKQLSKRGYVKQDDLRVQKNAESLRGLSGKYNGKNGLPAFDSAEVVAFAKRNGFGDNYESAYKEMHFDAIVEHEAKALSKALKAPSIEKPTGSAETPGKKRFTTQDIANMSDQEYEQYRENLLQSIKPQKS